MTPKTLGIQYTFCTFTQVKYISVQVGGGQGRNASVLVNVVNDHLFGTFGS